ncbi:MAG: hypothetical protein RR185_00935 [Angelakisella sp.]
MKIKQMTKWYCSYMGMTVLFMFGVLALLYLLSYVMLISSSETNFTIHGSEVATAITLFISGIAMFAAALRFGCTNGLSRKAVFLGSCTGLAVTCIAVMVGNLVLLWVGILTRGEGNSSFLYALYQEYMEQAQPVMRWLLSALWLFGVTAAAMLTGMVVGGIYYRLGRIGRVLWAAGLPVTLFVILPLVLSVSGKSTMHTLLNIVSAFATFLLATPLHLLLVLLGCILVLLGVDWLLMRRAPIQAA